MTCPARAARKYGSSCRCSENAAPPQTRIAASVTRSAASLAYALMPSTCSGVCSSGLAIDRAGGSQVGAGSGQLQRHPGQLRPDGGQLGQGLAEAFEPGGGGVRNGSVDGRLGQPDGDGDV